MITGAALGLPGADRLFDDGNIARLLAGEQGIDVLPGRMRREMLDKHITRLVKSDDGGASFETIDRLDAVIKLAARAGLFDLGEEFGVDADRVAALGRDTQMAIAAGIDALRDAGIPLVLRYKTTTTGTQLPDRWSLPDDDPGRNRRDLRLVVPGARGDDGRGLAVHHRQDAPRAARRARVAQGPDARP